MPNIRESCKFIYNCYGTPVAYSSQRLSEDAIIAGKQRQKTFRHQCLFPLPEIHNEPLISNQMCVTAKIIDFKVKTFRDSYSTSYAPEILNKKDLVLFLSFYPELAFEETPDA